jgi:AcrR family transcriptional regulator
VPRDLVDLLWRGHPEAPQGSTRGPHPKTTTSRVVAAASSLADAEGLSAVTVRRVAAAVGLSAMSVYTYVGSREDLLVLMADSALGAMPTSAYTDRRWADRVRRVAESNLALHVDHPWLLDVADQRVAMGPGAIAKYDRELRAFERLRLTDLDRDAALTFVLDFARASARTRRDESRAATMADIWASSSERLAAYLGPRYPLAQRVGAVAGAAMGAAYSPEHAWTFGLARVLAALEALPRSTTG